jgi:hypothetical protein
VQKFKKKSSGAKGLMNSDYGHVFCPSNNSAAPYVDLIERNMKKTSVMALELLVQL